MATIAVPPVVEGVKKAGATTYTIKEGGMDFFRPFVLTVHRAYCKYLNPEVEDGVLAFDRVRLWLARIRVEDRVLAFMNNPLLAQVLQYMHTKPLRLKLLRAVRIQLVPRINACLTLAHSTTTRYQPLPKFLILL